MSLPGYNAEDKHSECSGQASGRQRPMRALSFKNSQEVYVADKAEFGGNRRSDGNRLKREVRIRW